MGRLVVGLGTGRCGTRSLAALLDAQPGAHVTHERFYKALHWQGAEPVVGKLLAAARDGDGIEGDVASAYLPYGEFILARTNDARFVCLERERDATVASFLAKTRDKADHWRPGAGSMRHTGWNPSFPDYDHRISKEAAIGRYWDDYHRRAAALAAAYPDHFALFPVEVLNSAEGQREVLDFVGVPGDSQVLFEDGIKLNRSR